MGRVFGYDRAGGIMSGVYDFVADRTRDGRPLKMLTVVDEYTRECLAIDVERRADSMSVLERLAALFCGAGSSRAPSLG